MTETLRYIIRDGLEADITHCLALDHSYETDYVWQVNMRGESTEWSIHLREERLPRSMKVTYPKSDARLRYALHPQQCFLVAAQQDMCYGYLVMTWDSTRQFASLRDIVVDAAYRRRGIGTRLLSIARRWAIEKNISMIHAEVRTKNHPAIQLFQRGGYTFCGFNDQFFPNQDIAIFLSQSLHGR